MRIVSQIVFIISTCTHCAPPNIPAKEGVAYLCPTRYDWFGNGLSRCQTFAADTADLENSDSVPLDEIREQCEKDGGFIFEPQTTRDADYLLNKIYLGFSGVHFFHFRSGLEGNWHWIIKDEIGSTVSHLL